MFNQCEINREHIKEEDYSLVQDLVYTKIALGGLGFVNGLERSNGCSALAGCFAAMGKQLLTSVSKEEF